MTSKRQGVKRPASTDLADASNLKVARVDSDDLADEKEEVRDLNRANL
jgi:hypothetical protein